MSDNHPLRSLTDLGWSARPVDVCWLDCNQPGHMKTHRSREIVLCIRHAHILEDGRMEGTYSGAPLPPESAAADWPWHAAVPVDVVTPATGPIPKVRESA